MRPVSRGAGFWSATSCSPGGLAGTEQVVRFLAREISPATYLNLMDQYRPCHRASRFPPLDRSLSREEYRQALDAARSHGLAREGC